MEHTVCLEAPRIQPNQLLAACSRFSLAAAAAALFFSLSTCTAQAKPLQETFVLPYCRAHWLARFTGSQTWSVCAQDRDHCLPQHSNISCEVPQSQSRWWSIPWHERGAGTAGWWLLAAAGPSWLCTHPLPSGSPVSTCIHQVQLRRCHQTCKSPKSWA